MIHKQVEDENVFLHPIGWFLLEQDIIKATKGGVISRLECLGIAAVIYILMQKLSGEHWNTLMT